MVQEEALEPKLKRRQSATQDCSPRELLDMEKTWLHIGLSRYGKLWNTLRQNLENVVTHKVVKMWPNFGGQRFQGPSRAGVFSTVFHICFNVRFMEKYGKTWNTLRQDLQTCGYKYGCPDMAEIPGTAFSESGIALEYVNTYPKL